MTSSGDYAMDLIPSWLFGAAWCLLTLAAMEIGWRAGARQRRSADNPIESSVGSVAGAMLGLLAFIMAFTFGLAANRYDSRMQLLLEDVNSIRTAYARADLLREPHKSPSRALLREYVDLRADLASVSLHHDELVTLIARIELVQDELWAHATAVAEVERNSEIDALYIASLNDLIALHTKRVVFATQYRIPLLLWVVLGFVSALGMAAVGYQFGLSGGRSIFAAAILAVGFSAVILLIHELDRPLHGWIRVSQQPMIQLQHDMQSHSPPEGDPDREPHGA